MPDDPIPRLTSLRLARYAPGWGHPPGVLERAIRAGEALAMKVTQDPDTGAVYAPVFSLRLEIPTGSKRRASAQDLVVKVNPLVGLVERAKSQLGYSKHHRQWRGAERLERYALRTVVPLALLRGRCRLADSDVACEALLLPKLSGCTLLELLAQPPRGPTDLSLAERLGEQLAICARAGVWNRDPKPSNILVREDGSLVWLDTVGVGYRRGPDHALVRHAVKMLLVETRGVGRRCPEDFALRVVSSAIGARDSERARAMLREIHTAADAHGDATPQDDPLAPNT